MTETDDALDARWLLLLPRAPTRFSLLLPLGHAISARDPASTISPINSAKVPELLQHPTMDHLLQPPPLSAADTAA